MTGLFEPVLTNFHDEHSWAKAAADVVSEVIRARHDEGGAVLGLATGATPLLVYREFVRRHREEGLDFSRVRTFNLDEFVGIPADHAASFRRFMKDHLFTPLASPSNGLRSEHTHFPQTEATSAAALEAHCAAFEQAIVEAGGIDLQLLGIGMNGHIAFNEPGSTEETRTRVVQLHPSTRAPLTPLFGSLEHAPTHAVTMGVGTILEARRLLLLSLGARKRAILERALRDPVGPDVPASFVRRHPNVLVYAHERG